MTSKKDFDVNEESSLHDLMKIERQRYQESKAPNMSQLTADDFKNVVASALKGVEVSIDYDKIENIIRKVLAEKNTDQPAEDGDQDDRGSEDSQDETDESEAPKRTRKAAK